MNKYLTVEDVANLLQVPKSWVYEKVRLREMPSEKFGKYVRFDEQQLVSWIKAGKPKIKTTQKHGI